jgi:hypothetical protein
VEDCSIEGGGPADRVGAVRAIRLRDGTPVGEGVTALSDKDMSYSYSVIESPLPILGRKASAFQAEDIRLWLFLNP